MSSTNVVLGITLGGKLRNKVDFWVSIKAISEKEAIAVARIRYPQATRIVVKDRTCTQNF